MAFFVWRTMTTSTRWVETPLVHSSVRASQRVAVRKQGCSLSHVSTILPSYTPVRWHDVPTWHGLARRPAFSMSFPRADSCLKPVLHVVVKKGFLSTARGKGTGRRRKQFIPIKAAVELSDRARTFFARLLESPPRRDIVGIRLNYQQSHTGEPRMVFTFDFVTKEELHEEDEPVSLEVVTVVDQSDGHTRSVPKPPRDSWNDGLPKLYVSSNAFFKVLGATVDVDTDTMAPILHDAEGNRIDPNA